ncbi:MAG TPA: hypothetical protein VJ848_02980 [Candidatus Angelobacter sp.]|jgi:hypothetical protein|nr:hypothetical protein [Candidatus Angelobacter sp.]
MKKLLVIFAAAVMMTSLAAAQTATGTLTVSATVNGTISLVFNSDAAGVALSSGAGTNAASLDFGTVSAFGTLPAGVSRPAPTATNFTVSTPVDVLVNKANTASTNYTLTTQLSSADAANTWAANGAAFTNTTAGTATATGTYGSNVPVTLAITIPFTTASGTTISNVVNFTASAN